MRKSTKLLTILLTVVILCGLTVTAASAAAGQTRAVAPGAKYVTGISSDFQNADFNIYGPDGSVVDTGSGFIGQAGIGNRVGGLSVATNGTNKYMNYYHMNHNLSASYGSDTAGPGFYGAQLGGYRTNEQNFSYGIVYHDYITLDYELNADMYLNDENFLTEEETGKLSYMSLSMTLFARFYAPGASATMAQSGAVSPAVLSLVNKNDGWYLQNSTGSAAYKLPDKASEWTHISWVFEIDNSVTYKDGTTGDYDKARVDEIAGFHFSNSKAHIYINGEHLFTCDGIFSAVTDEVSSFINTETGINNVGGFGLEQIRIQTNPYTHAACKTTDFSMGFDNFSVYYYSNGYAGELASHLTTDPTQPIYLCDDVVYSGSYQTPYPNEPVASITDTEGYTIPYYIAQGALDKLASGDTLELFEDSARPYAPSFPFTIVHNGNSFALDAKSGYIAADHAEEGKYAVRKALTADYGDVVWDYKGDLYEITQCIGGQVPEYPYEVPSATQVGSQYKLFRGWSTEKNATEPSEIPAVEASEELFIYPVYKVIDVSYTITDNVTGEILVYGDDPAKLLQDYASTSAKDVKIVLHSDVTVTDSNSACNFSINGGKSIEFDLNGYDFIQTVIGKTPEVFRFEGAGNVNVYSSKPGSDLITLSHKPIDGAGVENGSGIVFVNTPAKTGEINVTIGNGTDNLTTHTTVFIQHYGSCPVNVNILGGRHLTPNANARGFIASRGAGLLTINMDNTIFSLKGHSFFYVESSKCSMIVNVNNSVIAGTGTSLFNYSQGTYLDHKNSSFTFTNTDIFVLNCNIKAGKPGCVVFGEGTRFNFEIPDDGIVVVADGCEKVAYTGEAVDYSYKVWHPEINTTEPYFFTINEASVSISGSFLYEIVANAPVVEDPVVDNGDNIGGDEEIDNGVAETLEENIIESEVLNNNVSAPTSEKAVTVKVEAPAITESVSASAAVTEADKLPTVAELILSYVRTFLRLTALPVTKNSLFII